MIHFHAFGTSQRGPSLKVPFEAIKKLGSRYLTEDCLHQLSPQPPTDDSGDSGYSSGLSTISELENAIYNIYIPTPAGISREEAFSYHLTTRNIVAYAIGTPVVGEKLSIALLRLWRRLREWLPDQPLRPNFVGYLKTQGYLSFAENAEHALACLKFAEEARFRSIWIDAFAHCAGMHERLDLSPEFAGVSKTTSALLTRASLEMDLHISRVLKALGGFLDAELGPELLGLSKPARDHLDHFRSFLHAHYVDKLGWFPPPRRSVWDKRPWREMQDDFQRLYDYLVDGDSSCDWTSIRGGNGGICMYQNVHAFDERHGYAPLPHPLALLPTRPTSLRRRSIASQTTLRNLKLGRTNSIPEAKITPYQALSIATNNLIGQPPSPLIQQYQRFEHQKLDAKLDIAEGRKVRWLLIYGVLQMLISITRGPEEVQDADYASYPVCVLLSGCPVPNEDEDDCDADTDDQGSVQSTPKAKLLIPDALDALEGRSSRISIHPDCEAEGAEEFFASHTISRQESELSLHQLSSSTWSSIPPSRTDSVRNSVQLSVQSLHKSFVGSLNKRSSRRLSLPVEPKTRASYCEIVVETYGNGLLFGDMRSQSSSPTALHTEKELPPLPGNPLLEFDFGLAAVNEEPVLDHSQLESQTSGFETPHVVDPSPRDSYFSNTSEDPTDSNRSSYVNDDDSDGTELSSYDEECSKRDSLNSSTDNMLELYKPTEPKSLTKSQLCYRPSRQRLGITSTCLSVNAGCYSPSGLVLAPKSRIVHHRKHVSDETVTSNTSFELLDDSDQAARLTYHLRRASFGTVTSNASSEYPEDSVQAAEIEEVDARGRRRSRALDTFAYERSFDTRAAG